MRKGFYWPGVDALRLTAALMVMAYHYMFAGPRMGMMPSVWPGWEGVAQYGYLGVDMFFIISGFVIAVTAEGRGAGAFAWARAKRLYPAYAAAVAVTTAVLAATGYGAVGWGQVAANVLAVQGLVGLPHVDGVYWSLAVEVQFYAGVALLLWLGRFEWLLGACALWLAASVMQVLWLEIPGGHRLLASWWAPYFTAGVALFHLVRGRQAWLAAAVWVASLLAAVPVGWKAAQVAMAATGATYDQTVMGVAVCALFGAAWLAALGRRENRRGAAARVCDQAGRMTYPLYLLHQYAGYALMGAGLGLAATATLVVAASWVVQRWVEPWGRGMMEAARVVVRRA